MSGLALAGTITGGALAILILLGGGFALGWTVRAVNANHEVDDQTGDITARADQRLADEHAAAQKTIDGITAEANRRIDRAEQTTATAQRKLTETNEEHARTVGHLADANRQLVELRTDHKTVLTENGQLAAQNEKLTKTLAKFGPLAADIPAEAAAHLAKVWDGGLTEPDEPAVDVAQNTKSWLREPSTRAIRAATDPNSREYAAAQAAIAKLDQTHGTFDAWNGDTYPVQPQPDADAVAAEHGPLPETMPVRKTTRPTRRARGRHNTDGSADKAKTTAGEPA